MQLTPKERSWLHSRRVFPLSGDLAHLLYDTRTGAVSGEHHIKVIEMRLAKAEIQIGDFFRCRLATFDLLVCRVVT